MTRSIFDPNSGETERSGSRNLGPDANQISQMPPDIIRGEEDETDEDECVMDMPSAEEIMHPTAESPAASTADLGAEATGESDMSTDGETAEDAADNTADDTADDTGSDISTGLPPK